jgi:hypothetical protein
VPKEPDEGLWTYLTTIFSFHHLWFLWVLCWLVLGFAVVVLLVERWPIPKLPDWLVLSPARIIWLIPLTMLFQSFMQGFGPDTSTGLIPMPHVVGYYAIFFGFGALYDTYEDREGRISRWWWGTLALGLLIILPLGLRLSLDRDAQRFLTVFVQSLYPWMMSVGLMGLFRALFSRESITLRYLSDSSYWLYLAHLPLIIAAQLVMRNWQMSANVKFGLICVTITAILLVTYHTLVRYTWMGRLLNGPRQRSRQTRATARDGV